MDSQPHPRQAVVCFVLFSSPFLGWLPSAHPEAATDLTVSVGECCLSGGAAKGSHDVRCFVLSSCTEKSCTCMVFSPLASLKGRGVWLPSSPPELLWLRSEGPLPGAYHVVCWMCWTRWESGLSSRFEAELFLWLLVLQSLVSGHIWSASRQV